MTTTLMPGLALILFCATGLGEPLRIEVERLEVKGGWEDSRGSAAVAAQYLFSGTASGTPPAVGAIDLPRAGTWRLWVRSKDYPNDRPGIRHFAVRLGTSRSARRFGTHGKEGVDGWEWEDGGAFELPAGPTLIVIGDEAQAYARVDALVLSDDPAYKPKGLPSRAAPTEAKMSPLRIEVKPSPHVRVLPPVGRVSDACAAEIANEETRWTFHAAATPGGDAIVSRAAAKSRDEWNRLASEPGAEGYHVVFSPADHDPRINAHGVFPKWDVSLGPMAEVSAGAGSAQTPLAAIHAPWGAGHHYALRPTTARQMDRQTVELTFPETPDGKLAATWRAATGLPAAQVTLTFTPSKPGRVTLGYHGIVASSLDSLDFLLLPFMYHGRRCPPAPTFMLNSHTPTPIALVNRGGLSYALTAEPKDIPFEWPGTATSRFALGIRNWAGQAQPMLYAPVLGLAGSDAEPGRPITARFHVWALTGDWYAAYSRVVTQLYQFGDYRRATYCSLSDAALNLIDLMKDAKSAGWDERAKGPWNIEMRNTVTQASPLTYMSYYLLTGEADFYARFARPSLEFLLSRPTPFFAAAAEAEPAHANRRLDGPVPLYGATVYAGALAMTHGRSAAFGDFILDAQGEPRPTKGYCHAQLFEETLALHRLTADAQWLPKAMAQADEYVSKSIRTRPTADLGVIPFLNISFVPDWEGLLHLAEATGERRFLDAAAEGARWLLTTIWTQPLIPDTEITVHPGGRYDHAKHVWWYGGKRYRLGLVDGDFPHEKIEGSDALPPTRLTEKRLPAWQVSNVGLGLEQPCTYTRQTHHANILMSTWAPNLLRLAALTGDPLFRTAARNATLGRFGNYPGYYVDGFTDHYQRPEYPFKGPDVTTIYHHHAPPFAAYVLDYLFTDAEVRSKGRVAFPWVRQLGYAWFDCRLRGHGPGAVYGRQAWPWLHRTAATVDNMNVDRVLAHGGDQFHVVLLNQATTPQTVRVTFDEATLGRRLDGAQVAIMLDNALGAALTAAQSKVSLTLSPLGIAALTLDGTKINVRTHRVAPPASLKLPVKPAMAKLPLEGTDMEARAAWILAPPFEWRDLYVYLTASHQECRRAVLRYRVGDGVEQTARCDQFPFEFSIRVADLRGIVTWRVEAQLADGRTVSTKSGSLPSEP